MKKLQILKRIWLLCQPFHWYIVVLVVFLFTGHALGALFPVTFGTLVTAVAHKDKHSIIFTLMCMGILLGSRSGISYFRERFEMKHLDYELGRYMSQISMEKFFQISMGQHNLGHSAIKRSVVTKGESAIAGIINMAIYDLGPTLFMILIPTFLMIAKVPLLGFCVLAAMSIFTLYSLKYNMGFVSLLRKLDTLSNRVFKKTVEVVENAQVVYVNAQEKRVCGECDYENSTLGTYGKPLWNQYLNWFYVGQLFVSLSHLTCLAIAGYLVYVDSITPGTFAMCFLWLGSAFGTMSNISNIQRNSAKTVAPIIKYFRFLDYEPDIVVPVHPVPIEHLRGQIEFRHVSFTYSSRTEKDELNDDEDSAEISTLDESTKIPALRDVSFVLEEGKRHAFVGKSGAGKSTLVGLILRAFDPQSGHVLVDGVDIRMLDYRELRRKIGLVPQDVSLFDGTMRYNITFGMNGSAEKVTDVELDSVSKLSRVSEFRDKLEKGWETIIGERGVKLSGGQRQRVGIARALIKNPHILIFDEATSSLDTENEARIRESITEASAGKTTVIIAHRLATVRDADKIFVFDEGKIVGEGTHEELLKSNEYYQRLVHNQVIMA